MMTPRIFVFACAHPMLGPILDFIYAEIRAWCKHKIIVKMMVVLGRYLHMLSLVLGSEITDAAVIAITSSYSNLELLDLSGYAQLFLV